MLKKKQQQDLLAVLLQASSAEILQNLVLKLATARPEIRRESFEFLNQHVKLSVAQKEQSEGEVLLALWSELDMDLYELDEYGGGDYAMVEHVEDLLYEIEQKLGENKIETSYRHDLLNSVLPFIARNNAGLEDALYDVAYACCYDDTELRGLAEAFEAMAGDWQQVHARRIYLKLGDRDKYLELRQRNMKTGADYYELARFYWQAGEKENALQVAENGLGKAEGRMDELRLFVAKRAKESGNRERYLELQYKQAIDDLTCDKYKAFRKLCTKTEWKVQQPIILSRLKTARSIEQIKIHMLRKEDTAAITELTNGRFPYVARDSDYEINTARKFETRFPEEILKYYASGLGNMKTNAVRNEYTRKARIMYKIRRVLVDVLQDKARWHKFAGNIKKDNIKRPAFQDEFAKVLPDWTELNLNP